MSENFLWSTYGVAGAGDDWNLAAIPSNGSKATAAFNADTFRILKATKHPDEAFEVLTYLLGDASAGAADHRTAGSPPGSPDQPKGSRPSRPSSRTRSTGRSPSTASTHADNPNFESYMPAYNETLGLVGSGGKYPTKWDIDAGLDMDAEFERAPDRDPVDLGQGGRWLTASASASLPISDAQASRRPQTGGRHCARRSMTAIDPPRRRSFVPAVLRLKPLARREANWGCIFIAPWVIGFLAFTLLPMVASLVFTFTNINLAQEKPLAFVGLDQLPAAARRPDRPGTSLGVTFRFAALNLPIAIDHPVRRRARAQQPLPARAEPLPDAVLPAVRDPVRRRASSSGRACSTSRPAG